MLTLNCLAGFMATISPSLESFSGGSALQVRDLWYVPQPRWVQKRQLACFWFFLGNNSAAPSASRLVRQFLGRQICRFGISFSMAYGESEMVSIRGYRGFFPLALFGVFATVAAATTLSSPRAGVLASRATRKCTRNYSLHKQWLSSQQLRASCGLSRAVLVSTTGGAHFSPGF